MIEVRSPVNQFFDTDGSPLDSGYIYIGTTGANPETNPQTVYWDKAGTIPAAQPLRTLNGYPSRDGAVSKFYTATKNYSITVKDKRGILVQSVLNSDSGVFDELTDEGSASGIGYNNTTSGLLATQVQAAIDEVNSDVEAAVGDIENLRVAYSGIINLFANGAFFVNQRNYASGTPTVAANQYTIDRIRVVVSGQGLLWVPSATFGVKITAPAGGAEQVIESNFVTGGEYACTWVGTGSITVNGVTTAKDETFTLPARTNATIRMFGEFEQFMLTRPEMIGRFGYNYATDLVFCKRYYEAIEVVHNSSPNTQYQTHLWNAEKRASPAISTIQISGSGMPTITQVNTGVFGVYQLTAPGAVGSMRISGSSEL